MEKTRIILFIDRVLMVCLCCLIFILPFRKAGIEVFAWLAIFLWIFKKTLNYAFGTMREIISPTDINKALGIFIAANAISTIFSVNHALSLRGFFGKELKFIAIYFMIVEVINNKGRLRNVLMAIMASAVLIIADAGVQYMRGVDFISKNPMWNGVRLSASFTMPNGFAGWLIVIILLILGLLAADKPVAKKSKALLLILALLLFVCLLLSYSRGAWLGLSIGIFLMAGYAIKNSALKIRLLWLLILVSLLSLLIFLPQPIKNKIETKGRINYSINRVVNDLRSMGNTEEVPGSVRINLWKESLMIIRDYPFIGCGLNTYARVAPNYKIFQYGVSYPHNSFLQMAAETGIVGLSSFLWVLFVFFKMGVRYLNQRRDPLVLGMIAGVLAFLAHSFFDTHFYALQLAVLFWFLMGLTTATIKNVKE